MEITEKTIGLAGLTSGEVRVARVFYNLETAGPKTKKWVEKLSEAKRCRFLDSAQKKLYNTQ